MKNKSSFGRTSNAESLDGFMRSVRATAMPVRRVTKELTWYYQDMDADYGFRAINWEPGVASNDLYEDDPNAEDRAIRVVAKDLQVRWAIQSISWGRQTVLEAYFGDKKPHRPFIVMKELGHIVHMTDMAKALKQPLDIACRDPKTARALCAAAEALLLDACEHYIAARYKNASRAVAA